jgi:ribosomal protein L11 methyltransferase
MFSLLIDCSHETRDLLIAELWETGVAGIVELPSGLRAFFEDDSDCLALSAQFGNAAIEQTEERDWVAESHEFLQPMLVGKRFYLVPEWRNDPPPDGRIAIRVNSGLAFGTGAHESTRLCLEALEELVTPGIAVADVGTGSGILAEAAKRLGAGRVVACDIDPLSIDVARANFEYAGLDIELFEGSIQKIESGFADLAIGNISPEWLALLAPDWLRILKPRGTLLLSGLEAHDVARVRTKLENVGLQVREMREENQWRCLVLFRAES